MWDASLGRNSLCYTLFWVLLSVEDKRWCGGRKSMHQVRLCQIEGGLVWGSEDRTAVQILVTHVSHWHTRFYHPPILIFEKLPPLNLSPSRLDYG